MKQKTERINSDSIKNNKTEIDLFVVELNGLFSDS